MATEISIWGLISNASGFVKFIMLTLFIMALTTLFLTGKKLIYFRRVKNKVEAFKRKYWSGHDLQQLFESLKGRYCEGLEVIFKAGFYEFTHFIEGKIRHSLVEPDVIVHNCRRAMEAAVQRQVAEQEGSGLNAMATFGSSAPYIGLLGTVYGIMTSFIALGGTQHASVNTVAPGIAEALIATAIGLLAAIPSVLSYNYFISKSEALNVEYDAFIEEFCNLLQRQIMLAKGKINK